MAQMNVRRPTATNRTFEGARVMREAPIEALERVLFAHMLFENTFYMDGVSSADVLASAVRAAADHDAEVTAETIRAARIVHNIRHASLLAAVVFAKHVKGGLSRRLIREVIMRADELAEVLVMAARPNTAGQPMTAMGVPKAIRLGVREAFDKFDEYQFGKYQGVTKAVSLKDAVFLTHPSTKNQPLVQKIVDGTLATPETWEVGLSTGGDKRDVFTNLLKQNRVGAMALLRNLRNMHEAGVDRELIAEAMDRTNWNRVLPFRFMSAAKTAPWAAPMLDRAFARAVSRSVYLPGRTAVLLDTSGSMLSPISRKSTVSSVHAGAVLAAAINGDHVDLIQWASTAKMVTHWQSLSTAMNIRTNEVGFGTNIGQAIGFTNRHGRYDRLIVITDMQFNDGKVAGLLPDQVGYTINTSSYGRPGLLYGNWTHLTGWSDAVLKYIASVESGD